jgi:histidine triad (HIT) family protein
MDSCIFCKIVKKEIPTTIIYEDDKFIAFNDINPIDRIHFLIIPKIHIINLIAADDEKIDFSIFGEMLKLAAVLSKKQGLEGFRTMINSGKKGGQEVFHIHFHVYGGSNRLKKI